MSDKITIYEDWDEREDGVYYKWKLPEDKEWHEKLSGYKTNPFIKVKYLTKEEFEQFKESYEEYGR